MNTKELEQALLDYAVNEASSEDVAQILNVNANNIQSALADFQDEWDEAEEPEDSDEVIDKWVAFFTHEGEISDIRLTKHNNGFDYLEWSYDGKEYWCQGGFYVDRDNVLHHTFFAPNGKEVEITCQYSAD